MLNELWEKSKGKIAVAGVAFLIGVPAVAGFLGIEAVEGPEGSVCFTQAEETTEGE